jgi:hypothetical protein
VSHRSLSRPVNQTYDGLAVSTLLDHYSYKFLVVIIIFIFQQFTVEITSLPRHQDEMLDDLPSTSRGSGKKRMEDVLELTVNSRDEKSDRREPNFSTRDFLFEKMMSSRDRPETREPEVNSPSRAYLGDLMPAGNFVSENVQPMNASKKQNGAHVCVDTHSFIPGTKYRQVTCKYSVTAACLHTASKHGTALCAKVRQTLNGKVYTVDCKCAS